MNGLVSAILPAVDGGERDHELPGELFLGKPPGFSDLPDKGWEVDTWVHLRLIPAVHGRSMPATIFLYNVLYHAVNSLREETRARPDG